MFQLHFGAKHPQCNFHSINKIGIQTNTALPHSCVIFSTLLFFGKILLQKSKIDQRKFENGVHIECGNCKNIVFLNLKHIFCCFITPCRVDKMGNLSLNLLKLRFHFQIQ